MKNVKSLNYLELEYLIKEYNNVIKNDFVSNVVVMNTNDIVISFAFYKKKKLFISLNNNSPFISFIDQNSDYSFVPSKMQEMLRTHIRDAKWIEIKTVQNERIVDIHIENLNELHQIDIYHIYLELIPNHSNLILTKNDIILFSKKYVKTADREIGINKQYILPPKSSFLADTPSLNIADYEQEALNYLPFAVKLKLKEKYSRLFETINKKLIIARKKAKILQDEIEDSKLKLTYQEYGQMILVYINSRDELNAFIQENNVPYDNSLSPAKNAEKLFTKFKKAKKTIQINNEQLVKNKQDIEKLENDLNCFNNLDEEELVQLSHEYLKTPITKVNAVKSNVPYYIEINETKIAYGKNSNQNDYLTFKIANKEHYFFHIKDYTGCHVILMKSEPNEEDIAHASQVAIYISHKDIGEVSYAKVSTIKKGQHSGQVILSSYKSYIVKNISEEVKSAIKNSKRFS